MSQFNTENWNHVQYISEGQKAIISMGAEPSDTDINYVYFVTLLDDDNNEIYQQQFSTIDPAVAHINKKYGLFWEFKDLKQPESTGGCGSCQAH